MTANEEWTLLKGLTYLQLFAVLSAIAGISISVPGGNGANDITGSMMYIEVFWAGVAVISIIYAVHKKGELDDKQRQCLEMAVGRVFLIVAFDLLATFPLAGLTAAAVVEQAKLNCEPPCEDQGGIKAGALFAEVPATVWRVSLVISAIASLPTISEGMRSVRIRSFAVASAALGFQGLITWAMQVNTDLRRLPSYNGDIPEASNWASLVMAVLATIRGIDAVRRDESDNQIHIATWMSLLFTGVALTICAGHDTHETFQIFSESGVSGSYYRAICAEKVLRLMGSCVFLVTLVQIVRSNMRRNWDAQEGQLLEYAN